MSSSQIVTSSSVKEFDQLEQREEEPTNVSVQEKTTDKCLCDAKGGTVAILKSNTYAM